MDSLLQQLNRAYDANPADTDAAAVLIAALRRVTAGQEIYRYQLRNLPCNIRPDAELWCIVGGMTDPFGNGSGGGILEWCYDRQDAETLMAQMQLDPRYNSLRVAKYWPDCTWCGRAKHESKQLAGSNGQRFCNDQCMAENEAADGYHDD